MSTWPRNKELGTNYNGKVVESTASLMAFQVFCQQWPGQLLYNLLAKTRESCSPSGMVMSGEGEIDISETRETCLSKMMCPQEQRNTQRMSKWSWYQSLNRQNWLLPGM